MSLFFVTFVGPWPGARPRRPELLEQNRQLVRNAVAAAHVGHGSLRFAFAKREITPLPGEPLAGYGDRWWRNQTCTGAANRLWARALGLAAGDEVVCIVALDLLCVTRDLRDRALDVLARKSRLSPDCVLFSATHTHSGPGGYSPELFARPFLGAPCAASRDRIVQAIAESVDEATRDLLKGEGRACSMRLWRTLPGQPVRVPIRNRLQAGLPVDDSATKIEIAAAEPGPPPYRVRILSLGAHATTRGPENRLADGDYPGELVEAIERPSSDLWEQPTAGLFLAGAVGSQALAPAASPMADYDWRSEVAVSGQSRSDDVTTAVLSALEVEIELPHASPKIAGFRVSPVLAGSQIASTGSLGFLRVGPLVIAAAPGDLSGELSLRAKKAVERPGRVLLPISFSGDYHGYLLPEERADLPGYEPAMMWHGPDSGELVTDALETGAAALFAR